MTPDHFSPNSKSQWLTTVRDLFVFWQATLEGEIVLQNPYGVLRERGYIYQQTDEDGILRAINGPRMTFYLGIDPTADSLHIGHFFALMMFRYLQEAGHRGILVIGGATALIGDPSGKSDLRQMLSKEEVSRNIQEVRTLAERFVSLDKDNPAIILNNSEWISPYNYIDFMRYVGIHFNINKMLSTETYAKRLEEGGLTFLEMGYMLMQSYDFVYLHRKYGCILQIGGSDQWGNIVAGVNLGRKLNYIEGVIETDSMLGLTCPLLMTNEGKKMGKTEHGTLWVAREKTTAFDFYQYFYNVNDADTDMLLKLFTRIPIDQIEELCRRDIVVAKRTMAFEITKLVHGDEEANKVLSAVDALFGNGVNIEDVPQCVVSKDAIRGGINVVELLTMTKFLPSKSEARRMILQGAIVIDGNKIDDVNQVVEFDMTKKNYILLKKGKKHFLKVCF